MAKRRRKPPPGKPEFDEQGKPIRYDSLGRRINPKSTEQALKNIQKENEPKLGPRQSEESLATLARFRHLGCTSEAQRAKALKQIQPTKEHRQQRRKSMAAKFDEALKDGSLDYYFDWMQRIWRDGVMETTVDTVDPETGETKKAMVEEPVLDQKMRMEAAETWANRLLGRPQQSVQVSGAGDGSVNFVAVQIERMNAFVAQANQIAHGKKEDQATRPAIEPVQE